MNKISVSSPTRVDLAGGTLDLWPLYSFVRGAVTINVAIDVKTHVTLESAAGAEIRIESPDVGLNKSFTNLVALLADPDPKLNLFRPILREMRPERGFHLISRSESPVGGGLGGSSSLTISLLKAFYQFNRQAEPAVHDLVHFAHNLEAEILKTPTGTQDYYPAASGGINLLRYGPRGIEQTILPVAGSGLEKRFLLVYTGRAHHSGLNNFEVMKSAIAGDATVLGALQELKHVAEELAIAVQSGQWGALGPLFRREYEARVRLAPAFTCPEIEELNRRALAAGAEAVKICGAGGGGCVMIWCPEAGRERMAEECRKGGFQVMNAHPVGPL